MNNLIKSHSTNIELPDHRKKRRFVILELAKANEDTHVQACIPLTVSLQASCKLTTVIITVSSTNSLQMQILILTYQEKLPKEKELHLVPGTLLAFISLAEDDDVLVSLFIII